MENEFSKKEIDDIMKSINFPFTDKMELKTDKNGTQWAFNLKEDEYFSNKFEVLYSEDDTRLEDGIYPSNLFEEGFLAASIIASNAQVPLQSNQRFIILKRKSSS